MLALQSTWSPHHIPIWTGEVSLTLKPLQLHSVPITNVLHPDPRGSHFHLPH